MSITTVPSAITGQTLSAADWNTQVRDNLNGIWVLTTAGDMLYATGASAAARLALVAGGVVYGGASAPAYTPTGGKNSFLKADGSNGVAFASPLYRRQGGSSTIFVSAGTTNYTPAGLVMQSGYKNITVSGTGAGVFITYPVAFVHRPHIILSVELDDTQPYVWSLGHSGDTVSGFYAHLKFAGSLSITCAIGWLAFSDE